MSVRLHSCQTSECVECIKRGVDCMNSWVDRMNRWIECMNRWIDCMNRWECARMGEEAKEEDRGGGSSY